MFAVDDVGIMFAACVASCFAQNRKDISGKGEEKKREQKWFRPKLGKYVGKGEEKKEERKWFRPKLGKYVGKGEKKKEERKWFRPKQERCPRKANKLGGKRYKQERTDR